MGRVGSRGCVNSRTECIGKPITSKPLDASACRVCLVRNTFNSTSDELRNQFFQEFSDSMCLSGVAGPDRDRSTCIARRGQFDNGTFKLSRRRPG